MKVEIDVDWELSDIIVAKNLKELLETLEDDYESRKQGTGMSIFDTDKDKDIKLLKKHIKAMKLILKYYVGDL
jgi:hypothetical protein